MTLWVRIVYGEEFVFLIPGTHPPKIDSSIISFRPYRKLFINNSKPRLLVLTSTYPRWPGDTEPAFAHELSKRLNADFEVNVLAPHAPGAARHEIMDGVHIHRYRYAPQKLEQLAYEGGMSEKLRHGRWRVLLVPLMLTSQFIATWSLIRSLKPIAIHAHWIFPQAFVAVLARIHTGSGQPIVCTVHGADWYRLRGRFWNRVKQFTLTRCQSVAPVSGVLRADIESTGWVKGELTNPMPMGIHVPDKVPPLSEREPNSLFFVGRLVPKKGLNVLISAAEILKRSGTAFRLQIAGGGEEQPRYKQTVSELRLNDNIQFLGPISHQKVYEHMSRNRFCIVPSLPAADGDQEGLGLVLLEALANGCNVIASDIPVFREIVENTRGNSRLIKAGDAEALADAIRQSIESQNHLFHAGSRETLGQYAWPEAAKRYNKYFANFSDAPQAKPNHTNPNE